MKRKIKYVISMHARRITKSVIKTNLALISHLKKSIQRINNTNNIYMLMYHRVNDYRNNEMSVSVNEFKRQVIWLKEMGFQNMRMAEIELMTSDSILKSPKVIFSFDDGYKDNFIKAFPVLKEFGYTAIFYIPYAPIGKQDMYPRDIMESNHLEHNQIMDWQNVEDMYKSGMEIGSHTLTHKDLTQMSDVQAKKEIIESKTKIEEKLGAPITSFCYPGGYFHEKHIDWVKEAGYLSACTTETGYYNSESLFEIPRIAVLASDSFFIFKQKIVGDGKLFKIVR